MLVFCLFVLFVAAYVQAYRRGRWDKERTCRANRPLLRLTSAVLVLGALAFYLRLPGDSPYRGYTGWIAMGMTVSFLGDLVTGGILPFRRTYAVATLVFGAAHACYLAAFSRVRQALSIPFGWYYWVAALAFAIACWVWFIRKPGVKSLMNRLSVAYALLLGSVLGAALSLFAQNPRFFTLAVGAVLFSMSDILLGNREIRKNRWILMYDVIWALYISGQFFIVSSGYFISR